MHACIHTCIPQNSLVIIWTLHIVSSSFHFAFSAVNVHSVIRCPHSTGRQFSTYPATDSAREGKMSAHAFAFDSRMMSQLGHTSLNRNLERLLAEKMQVSLMAATATTIRSLADLASNVILFRFAMLLGSGTRIYYPTPSS